nr:hypothetical protein 1634Bnrm3_p152 [Cryptomonas sp.]
MKYKKHFKRKKIISTTVINKNSKRVVNALLKDILWKKKNFKSSLSDSAVKNLNIIKKKQFFNSLIRNVTRYEDIKLRFSFCFLSIRIGTSSVFSKFLQPKVQDNRFSEFFFVLVSFYEWEYYSCIKSSLKSLKNGLKLKSFWKFIPKEYFRLLVFCIKKNPLSNNINQNQKNSTMYPNSKHIPNQILLHVVSSFRFWNLDKVLLENIIQISAKEVWLFPNMKFVFKYLEKIIKMKYIGDLILLETLNYLLIPQSLKLKFPILKHLVENYFSLRSIYTKNLDAAHYDLEHIFPIKEKNKQTLYFNVYHKNCTEFIRVKLYLLDNMIYV